MEGTEPQEAATEADATTPEPDSEEQSGTRRRPWVRWVRRGALVVVLLLVVPLLAIETALRINYMGDPADTAYSRDRDAMWLGHAWVDGRAR